MKTTLALLLIIAAAGQAHSGCCSSSSCSHCNTQPSCCSSCCQQTKCCEKTLDCCKEKCTAACPPVQTPCPPTSTPCPPTLTPSPPTPAPPRPSPVTPGTAEVSSGVNNSQAVQTNLKIDNTITNTNKIYVPIHITNTNINSIGTREATAVVAPHPPIPIAPLPPAVPTTGEIRESTTPNYYIIRPILVPVPFPYPVHYPIPQRQGCCTVVNTCIHQQCIPYQQTCGHHCSHPVLYRPHNPCLYGGCARKESWMRHTCQHSHQFPFVNCGYFQQDCSSCSHNFYQEYSSYEQCRGCFY